MKLTSRTRLPPRREPCIVVDATFPWRLASELRGRGLNATSPRELGRPGLKDPPLLRLINWYLEPAVLVTFDNKMAVEHRELLDRYKTTLVVVDQNRPPDGSLLDQYWRDVIHRHAHRFVAQDRGARFMYRQRGRGPRL